MPADGATTAAVEARLRAMRRAPERSDRGRPRQRRQSVQAVADRAFRRADREAGGRRPEAPLRRHVRTLGRGCRGTCHRRRAVRAGRGRGSARRVVWRVFVGRAPRALRSCRPLHWRRQRSLAHRRHDPVPIVGLYGPTLPVRSAPWRSDRYPTESVDVGELPCRPCDQRVCAPGDFRCLTRIQPEQVLEACFESSLTGRAKRSVRLRLVRVRALPRSR